MADAKRGGVAQDADAEGPRGEADGDSEVEGETKAGKEGRREMTTKALVMILGLFVFGTAVAAADLTGNWRLDLSPNFGGEGQTLLCTLKQADLTLSAECEGGQFTGRIEGTKVILQVKTGRNNELTAMFEGTANEAGTTITGAWRLADSSGERTGKFAFTKR